MHVSSFVQKKHRMERSEINETGDAQPVGGMGWKEFGDGSEVQRICWVDLFVQFWVLESC